jgi:hypothetical protein
MPSWCAFTAVAPIVRFNAFEIFATPTLFLARDFISRRSGEVHVRRTAFFLAGILSSLFWGAAFYHTRFAWQCASCRDLAGPHCA